MAVFGMFRKNAKEASSLGKVDRDAALWAIRLFLGREPSDEDEVQFHRGHPHLESVRRSFVQTAEFRAFYASLTGGGTWAAPLFLLQPPASPAVPWRLEPPTLAAPLSQLCTQAQFDEPLFDELCIQLGELNRHHRKIWEFVWIAAAARAAGLLRPGLRAVGFGVGQEPMPAFFAAHGVEVLATDAPLDLDHMQGWTSTGQHTTSLDPLRRPLLLDDAAFDERVHFRPCDMNAIPDDITGYDLCWSSCAFEHLGSIEHGLRFVEESLRTLRPGGLALHTTEFNLGSNDATFEAPDLSIFRKRDFEALFERLVAAGHEPLPLNTHPGTGPADAHIDLPPYAMPHLKLQVAGQVSTSVGIAVRKAG